MRAPLSWTTPEDVFDPAWVEDPHPVLARLRREAPLSRVGGTGVHLVATWDLVDEALRREADFSANLTGLLIRGEDGAPSTIELPASAASQVIATADEPRHAVHRALSQPRLAAKRMAELEAPLRAWTLEALAPLLRVGGGDFAPLTEIVPARAVALILGLPDGDVANFRTWAMMGGDMLAGDVSSAQMAAFGQETGRMAAYLRKHLELALGELREGPDAPLLHALGRGVAADEISVDEAIGISTVMFGAGGESTAALIGNALRMLATRPELADELRAQPEQIPRFVEEVARLEPPFKFHYRSVRTHCELGGYTLAPGDRLLLLWASANRDAAYFEAPDELRLDRRHPKQHMSFGRGTHFCIGAPLARLEARVVCEEALRGTKQLALREGEPPEYARSIFIRRHERLPLALDAA